MPSIAQVTKQLRSGFLGQQNVVSIGHQNGRIVITVVGEQEAKKLNRKLGGTVAGYPVEIQVSHSHFSFSTVFRPAGTPSLQVSTAPGRGDRVRPLVGGVQTGVAVQGRTQPWWGTLTGVWKDRQTGGLLLVSNRHVWRTMKQSGGPGRGASILQPVSRSSQAPQGNIVGRLDRWSSFSGTNPLAIPVDVSAASTTEKALGQIASMVRPSQKLIRVQGTATPSPGDDIVKYGARSGRTTGQILQSDTAVKLQGDHGQTIIVEHALKASAASQPGDSGSPILTPGGELVGQLFGGTPQDSGPCLGNLIGPVNDILGADPVAVMAPRSSGSSQSSQSSQSSSSGGVSPSLLALGGVAGLGVLGGIAAVESRHSHGRQSRHVGF